MVRVWKWRPIQQGTRHNPNLTPEFPCRRIQNSRLVGHALWHLQMFVKGLQWKACIALNIADEAALVFISMLRHRRLRLRESMTSVTEGRGGVWGLGLSWEQKLGDYQLKMGTRHIANTSNSGECRGLNNYPYYFGGSLLYSYGKWAPKSYSNS